MNTVASKDGTPIAFERCGSGPPLVLVHGTTASHTRWLPVLPALAEEFSVYAIDRRGRGASGDADNYAIEREFEDVAAVVDSLDEPVNLLGHSYGAICALEATLLTGNVAKLILYEPPVAVSGALAARDDVSLRLHALLDAGDREGVVATFMQEVVGMPDHELQRYKALPAWPARVAAAHTLPREDQGQKQYRFLPERFAQMRVPTLLLLGGDSPVAFGDATRAVDAALPDSRIAVLPGQQHIAIDTAPELFTGEVLAFLTGAKLGQPV
jgi:pimeloyl-ACP methyl ester carboxylesterase